jgi:hypothetical protein
MREQLVLIRLGGQLEGSVAVPLEPQVAISVFSRNFCPCPGSTLSSDTRLDSNPSVTIVPVWYKNETGTT